VELEKVPEGDWLCASCQVRGSVLKFTLNLVVGIVAASR
jgi:hypothetical protein